MVKEDVMRPAVVVVVQHLLRSQLLVLAVFTQAKMPEVLQLTTSGRLLVSFRLFASHPKGCKNRKEVQLRI